MTSNTTDSGFPADGSVTWSWITEDDQLSADNTSLLPANGSSYPWTTLGIIDRTVVGVSILSSQVVLAANLLVIVSFIKFEYIRTRENTTLLSLSVSDLLTVPGIFTANVLLLLPASASDTAKYPCLTTAFLLALSFIGQTWSTVLITVDRWISVFYPLRHESIFTPRKVHVLVVATWVGLVAVVAACMWEHRWVPGSRCFPLRLVEPRLAVILGVPLLVLPLLIMPILYGLLYRQAVRQQQQIRQQMQISSERTQKEQLDSHKPTRTLGLILGVLYLTWLPILLATYVMTIRSHSPAAIVGQKLFMDLATVILFASSFLNPLIYHRSSPAFRRAFTTLLYRDRAREQRRRRMIHYLQQEKITGQGCDNPAMDRTAPDFPRELHVTCPGTLVVK